MRSFAVVVSLVTAVWTSSSVEANPILGMIRELTLLGSIGVIGGARLTNDEQAIYGYAGTVGRGTTPKGSGSLIGCPSVVLTARHVVRPARSEPPDSFTPAGSTTRLAFSHDIEILDLPARATASEADYHDLALVKLAQPAPAASPLAVLAAFPIDRPTPATVVGAGLTSSSLAERAADLRIGTVKVLGQVRERELEQGLEEREYLSHPEMMLTVPGPTGQIAMPGDSGGPLALAYAGTSSRFSLVYGVNVAVDARFREHGEDVRMSSRQLFTVPAASHRAWIERTVRRMCGRDVTVFDTTDRRNTRALESDRWQVPDVGFPAAGRTFIPARELQEEAMRRHRDRVHSARGTREPEPLITTGRWVEYGVAVTDYTRAFLLCRAHTMRLPTLEEAPIVGERAAIHFSRYGHGRAQTGWFWTSATAREQRKSWAYIAPAGNESRERARPIGDQGNVICVR